MILVVGATGLVGGEVCQRLARRGETVRALVRESSSPGKVAALREAGVELFAGDLKDPESIAAACQGVDAVISTASSTLVRQAGDSIETVDLEGQLNLVKAARNAQAGRFVFVSFRRNPELRFPLAEAKGSARGLDSITRMRRRASTGQERARSVLSPSGMWPRSARSWFDIPRRNGRLSSLVGRRR